MSTFEHDFYLKSEAEQKFFIWKVASLLLFISAMILFICWITGWYFLLLLFAGILMIFAPFIDTPSGKKQGKLIYYSPLFIVEKQKEDKLVLHGGTLFDYYFVIDRDQNSAERTKFILRNYLQGIVNMIHEYEQSGKPNPKIKATSYIINERTAKKAGFKVVKTDGLQSIILFLNYIPLTLSYSISKGKLSFPNISKVKSYKCEMKDLIARKDFLQSLLKRFDAKSSEKVV